MNGNPNKIITQGDGWNEEDFSSIKGENLTVDHHQVQRVYPRRIQGNVVNFYYNDLSTDGAGITSQWASITADDQLFFNDKEFALLTWQGQESSAPTEIFIPKHFDINNLTVITDQQVFQGNPLNHPENGDIWGTQDIGSNNSSGYKLMIQSDLVNSPTSNPDSFHYALIVDKNTLNAPSLEQIQTSVSETIRRQQRPVYLTGKMQGNEYPDEAPQTYAISIVEVKSYQFFIWRLVTLQWETDEAVTIFKNGVAKTQGKAEDKKYIWSRVGKKDVFTLCKQSQPTACSKEIAFY